ncbi:unnamed protein product, partial [marine sediment metagenome]
FLIANAQEQIMDQFASYQKSIGAKSIDLPKYEQLALATTPLTDKEDPASEALVDSKVTLTPAEYGNVVTTTKLANVQTGGTSDRAAARLVGINAGRTQDKLAILSLDASSNELYPGAVASEGALVAGDIMASELLNRAYNKLARASVSGLIGGDYVAVMHDDVIHDLRETSAAGSWLDVNKYAMPGEVLKNELGMYRGFRIVRDNHSTLTADAGAAAVDSYRSYFMGFNAFGKAVSQEPTLKLTGPFDKLARFINMGWTGCFQYKIVESDALYVGVSASSVGVNV